LCASLALRDSIPGFKGYMKGRSQARMLSDVRVTSQ
jgi:hypothetical protein